MEKHNMAGLHNMYLICKLFCGQIKDFSGKKYGKIK
jgi:hypothetical protein